MPSDDIYISAFEMYCDMGRYSAVATQMGITPTTAKRWVRKGGDIWRKRNRAAVQAAIERENAPTKNRT